MSQDFAYICSDLSVNESSSLSTISAVLLAEFEMILLWVKSPSSARLALTEQQQV